MARVNVSLSSLSKSDRLPSIRMAVLWESGFPYSRSFCGNLKLWFGFFYVFMYSLKNH